MNFYFTLILNFFRMDFVQLNNNKEIKNNEYELELRKRKVTVSDIRQMEDGMEVKKCIVKIVQRFDINESEKRFIRMLVQDDSDPSPLSVSIYVYCNDYYYCKFLPMYPLNSIITIKNAYKKKPNNSNGSLLIIDNVNNIKKLASQYYDLKFEKILSRNLIIPIARLMRDAFNHQFTDNIICVLIIESKEAQRNTVGEMIKCITVGDSSYVTEIVLSGQKNIDWFNKQLVTEGAWYIIQNFEKITGLGPLKNCSTFKKRIYLNKMWTIIKQANANEDVIKNKYSKPCRKTLERLNTNQINGNIVSISKSKYYTFLKNKKIFLHFRLGKLLLLR